MGNFDLSWITNFISVDSIIKWFSGLLESKYGINELDVRRTNDSVVLVAKGKELDKLEEDLRTAITNLQYGKKIEVDVGGEDEESNREESE